MPAYRFVRSLLSVLAHKPAAFPDPPSTTTASLEMASIAHDLRNLLMVIDGAACMALDLLGDSHPAKGDLVEIRRCATRATAATERLLTPAVRAASVAEHGADGLSSEPIRPAGPSSLARPSGSAAQSADVGSVVSSLEPMLHRLVGPNVHLDIDATPCSGRVGLAPTAVENLVINLVINARDALEGAGTISVRVGRAVAGDPHEGDVELVVTDTGRGISPEIRSRIFEPYVTTKEGGSGLGLAIVADAARSVGGRVDVADRPGGGTIFRVVMPRVEVPPKGEVVELGSAQRCLG